MGAIIMGFAAVISGLGGMLHQQSQPHQHTVAPGPATPHH
jgi:hypothetical protein